MQLLEPESLMFLGQLILDLGYFAEDSKIELAKKMFDINMGFALMFRKTKEQVMCHKLIKQAMVNLSLIKDNMALFAKDETLVKDFFSSKLLEAISKRLEMDKENFSDREKLALELVSQIVKLQKKLQEDHGMEVELNFELHDTLKQTLKM